MLVRADNGIDHPVFVIVIADQHLKNALETPAPPVEALVDDLINFQMPGPFKCQVLSNTKSRHGTCFL
jgi:hypothetical protein